MPNAPLEIIRSRQRAAALLEPTRQRLLARLVTPNSAAGLARQLDLPRQRLNYHLRALERAGLVELVEERKKGNCVERVVRATARAFVISPELLGTLADAPESARDRFSASYLIAAAGRVIREVVSFENKARREGKRVATFAIEADVRFANAHARASFAEELADAVARITTKYHQDGAPAGRTFRVLAAVHPTHVQGVADDGRNH